MDACPCGSGRELTDCCLPIIRRERKAPNAEALMRSRYTAFTRAEVDWILDSHHPDTVEEVDRDDIEQWATTADWMGLRIRGTEAGGEDDDEGIVDFRARYRVQGQQVDHVERASFRRHEGEWKFHSVEEEAGDGPELVPVAPRSTVGRNDPCTCGSGKKYKRCCGAAA